MTKKTRTNLTPEEAFEFITKHRLTVNPIIGLANENDRDRKRNPKTAILFWHVSNSRLNPTNLRQNLSDWIIKGASAIEAITIAKEWMEAGKLPGPGEILSYHDFVVNQEEFEKPHKKEN